MVASVNTYVSVSAKTPFTVQPYTVRIAQDVSAETSMPTRHGSGDRENRGTRELVSA
jgi:hypothetical protein